MQELIEWMEKDLENGKKTIGNILEKSNKLLEKEKEQIINAHTNAYLIGEDNISVEDANKASEQYYNQTYNK